MCASGSTRKRCGFVVFGYQGALTASEQDKDDASATQALVWTNNRMWSSSTKTTVSQQDRARVAALQQWFSNLYGNHEIPGIGRCRTLSAVPAIETPTTVNEPIYFDLCVMVKSAPKKCLLTVGPVRLEEAFYFFAVDKSQRLEAIVIVRGDKVGIPRVCVVGCYNTRMR